MALHYLADLHCLVLAGLPRRCISFPCSLLFAAKASLAGGTDWAAVQLPASAKTGFNILVGRTGTPVAGHATLPKAR